MTIKTLTSFRLRAITLAVCALILVWLIVSRSLAAYLANIAPAEALWLNPREPQALVKLADQTLNGAADAGTRTDTASRAPAAGVPANAQKQGGPFAAFAMVDQKQTVDLSKVRELAAAALIDEPVNAIALRILGQAADAANDRAAASRYMHDAVRLSLHDAIAVYWLMLKSAEAKDYKSTVYYANALLRVDPDIGPYVVPVLARVAEDKASVGFLKKVLDSDPPWRDYFLQTLPLDVTDERTPLDLLLALRTSAQPPARQDVNHYLEFLVRHKMYALAYYTWLQFLPAEQLRSAGFLYNGDFAVAPSGSPFDWVISQGAGVTVDIEPTPGRNGADALIVNFMYGRVDFHSVTQLIMLPPGRYQFTGLHRGNIVGPRGLRWRIACAENRTKPFAQSDMIDGRATDWRGTELDFTVPDQNCRAQYISLDLDARMPSEQFVTGKMQFGDLRISRVANAAPPAAEENMEIP